jgi:hypothetical protein
MSIVLALVVAGAEVVFKPSVSVPLDPWMVNRVELSADFLFKGVKDQSLDFKLQNASVGGVLGNMGAEFGVTRQFDFSTKKDVERWEYKLGLNNTQTF